MPDKKGSPFREVVDHFAEMQRMREHFRHPGEPTEQRSHDSAWVPTTDIFASGDDLIIRCELAGVEPDEVEISLLRGVLWIGGERRPRPDQEGEISYYVHERRFGYFRRSITLPQSIGRERLHASFENGLLEILVERGAASEDRERIEVRGRGKRASLPVDAGPGTGPDR
jgi:HSP20 family protein